MPIKWQQKEMAGWGRYPLGVSDVALPARTAELQAATSTGLQGKALSRGAGRSYGDAALNTGNRLLLTGQLDRVVQFDREKGLLTGEAGLALADIIRIGMPHGWFPPVVPGTRYPTLGGSLAADIHGKNHHVAGSFARHVPSFDLVLASGEEVHCTREGTPELFDATAGGMGLTGIISRVTVQLQPIGSQQMEVRTLRTGSLRETMEQLRAEDARWPYTVSWVDSTAEGGGSGRGHVILGRHHEGRTEELTADPLQAPRAGVPMPLPISAVHPLTIRAFNEAYYRKLGRARSVDSLEPLSGYFFPLDVLTEWHHLYGPKGFLQYQFVVGEEVAESLISKVLEQCRRAGHPSALTVLKRFGQQEGLLSFPRPGWTLAMDLPVRTGLFGLLDRFDRTVADHGGRVYLAKDARMKGELFREMYSEYPDWLEIKRRVDPECRFSSDLSRRLGIDSDVVG